MSARLTALFAALAGAPLLLTALFFTFIVSIDGVELDERAAAALAWLTFLLALGGVAAALLVWSYLRRRVSGPLQMISERVERIGLGDLAGSLNFDSDDELAEAAESLNRLAGRIAATQADLKEQIREGARDLGRALGELQLLKRLNDAIIHNIPSSIAVLNHDGRLLYFNASFERVWGISTLSLGQPLRATGDGGPLTEIDWTRALLRMRISGEPLRNEVVETGVWPDRRVVRYSLFPLSDANFEASLRLMEDAFCVAFVAPEDCHRDCDQCAAHSVSWKGPLALLLLDDITEQCQLEAQLIQSEKLAALGQLSAGVAHEMRNPLSAIYNAAFYISDVLTDDEPDVAELQEYVALIQRNVDRAQRTVTNILSFARPTGSHTVQDDLSDLVRQTLAILDKAMVDQQVELRTELEPDVQVMCRPETVKQALLNLIVNALQAMPEGGTLVLKTTSPLGAGGMPLLTVSDTGCGIPPEHLHHIFNPFFTTKPPGQGTGLGLSIARQAIEADGGRLEVESVVGRGTTFRLFLPAPEAPATHSAEAKELPSGVGRV